MQVVVSISPRIFITRLATFKLAFLGVPYKMITKSAQKIYAKDVWIYSSNNIRSSIVWNGTFIRSYIFLEFWMNVSS